MSAYTDDDVQTGLVALLGFEPHPTTHDAWSGSMRRAIAAVAPAIAARALREAAEQTIAEAVCCDEYERFKTTGERPKYRHHICYWGAAHAEALHARADEIERTP